MDLIYGRGITDLVREMPYFLSLVRKYAAIRFFNAKPAIFGSADINNVCNLHCSHCYWWLNRKDGEDLSAEDWRQIIRNTFKKERVFYVTLVGGEPMMRPDIIEVFCEEMPGRICVVTNGTYPLKRFEDLYFYWVSVDGTEETHDSIRGKGSYARTRRNILDYISGPDRNGKPAWKDIWLSVTINSVNYHTIEDLVEEWNDKVNKIAFQFHTPFMKGDPLLLPFGSKRDEVVEKIIELHRKYPDFVMNDEKQISLMKGNWGGIGTTPIGCPTWSILALDHKGRMKHPCCIGSADANSQKPICEDCGLGCYSMLVAQGISGS